MYSVVNMQSLQLWPHNSNAKWATILMLYQPRIKALTVKMVTTTKLPDTFSVCVDIQTNTAIHVPLFQTARIFSKFYEFCMGVKDPLGNPTLNICLCQTVKKR